MNKSIITNESETASADASGGLMQRKCDCGNHAMSGSCNDCANKKSSLQRKLSSAPTSSEAPSIVHEVLRSSGQPLDSSTRAFMEPRFGHDFSHVRVHTDAKAAASAQAVNARAYTVGRDVVFGTGSYSPQMGEGRKLIAHELTHVAQQAQQTESTLGLTIGPANSSDETQAERVADAVMVRENNVPLSKRTSANILRRTPAPPTVGGQTATFDRSKVNIGELPNVVATKAGGAKVTLTPPKLMVTVAISDPQVNHLSWELYDPTDRFLSGPTTNPNFAEATTYPFMLYGGIFDDLLSQGRYTLRCVGKRNNSPIVYADRTFYIWTSAPISTQDQASLSGITSSPGTHSLSEVGAAYARSMMLQHQASVRASGTGKYMGADLTAAPPAGVTKQDCTTYVLEVLRTAFAAKGRAADWKAVFDEAQKTSAGKFKGTELLKALETKAGWKGVFWSPDPRNPADKSSEHPVAYKGVKAQGTYYGINVDKAKSVIDYRPTSTTKQESMTRLDQLRQIPLAVIAARGGLHMTLLLNGDVYEVHYDKEATDPDVITAIPLEKWGWQSGVVMMPPETFKASFTP